MPEPLPFAFLTDCKALQSILAHPNLAQRLHVVTDSTDKARPEPLTYYGDQLTLSRFDDPEMIGFNLPRLGDQEQHYLINARFGNALLASVLRLVHCRGCSERVDCLPRVRKIQVANTVAGIVLANHHYT